MFAEDDVGDLVLVETKVRLREQLAGYICSVCGGRGGVLLKLLSLGGIARSPGIDFLEASGGFAKEAEQFLDRFPLRIRVTDDVGAGKDGEIDFEDGMSIDLDRGLFGLDEEVAVKGAFGEFVV